MTVYTDKIYPPLDPSAPMDDEPQSYRLKKIDEMGKFLREEIIYRDKLAKRSKRRAIALTFSDTIVITTITTLEIASIATITTGIGVPVSIVLASTGLLLGLGSVVVHKAQKICDSKAKKHDKIKTLAEAKLDTISGLVSKAIEDEHIDHNEYKFVLKEVENYRKLKEQIRTKNKRHVNAISSEQKDLLREEGKQAFLEQIAATSGTQTANVI